MSYFGIWYFIKWGCCLCILDINNHRRKSGGFLIRNCFFWIWFWPHLENALCNFQQSHGALVWTWVMSWVLGQFTWGSQHGVKTLDRGNKRYCWNTGTKALRSSLLCWSREREMNFPNVILWKCKSFHWNNSEGEKIIISPPPFIFSF